MRRLKIILSVLGTFLLLGSTAGVFLIFHISSFSRTPVVLPDPETVFQISSGQNLKTISRNLEQQQIVTSSFLFQVFTRLKGRDKEIQAGEYVFSGAVTPQQVLTAFVLGQVRLYKVTIPEGLNIEEIGIIFEKSGFCTAKMFSELAHDPEFILTCDVRQSSLEGYLYPETYFFPKNTSCRTILMNMVKRFQSVYSGEWERQAAVLGMSTHEIVTLASIIEKETGAAFERPLISSVFHNRLKKGMRLESDPTVIYGIENFNGNITRRHLRTKTPYNTYQIAGLPPGPIANPGFLSLKAALYPETTPFFFFVSKKDQTHQFSETIQEHNQAVKKYQLNR